MIAFARDMELLSKRAYFYANGILNEDEDKPLIGILTDANGLSLGGELAFALADEVDEKGLNQGAQGLLTAKGLILPFHHIVYGYVVRRGENTSPFFDNFRQLLDFGLVQRDRAFSKGEQRVRVTGKADNDAGGNRMLGAGKRVLAVGWMNDQTVLLQYSAVQC